MIEETAVDLLNEEPDAIDPLREALADPAAKKVRFMLTWPRKER